MNITIKQIQSFVAVATAHSFAEACAELHLSQPALSISIKKLEEAIGGQLITRTTRSVVLSPEGEQFYPVAKRLLADWENSLQDVSNLFSLRRGKLDIAVMPTFASSLLPALLNRYHQQFPDINITVHDVISENVVNMVRSGHAEIGITFDPGEQQDLNFTPLFLDRFVAVLPQEHPLLALKTLKWSNLTGLPFIALQRPSSIRLLIDEILENYNISLAPVFEAHQLATIGRMVAQGLGVSVVPSLSEDQMHELGAQCRPVKGPIINRNVGVITRSRQPLSSAAKSMLDAIVT
ncbi:LysR family transcriptional regulator [Oceanicoccus sp. KOV_DT_Chl]|uniref:LysR family transcriptional regulator n=1 Tax=Oceanicoccus sp. KOV_DT_Chl TaxID=1904639 RepID=UPI000C7D6284|nr:LysR family transcriptional regulator [Oceanicoccus sp. KOV_DT_Chl]